MTRIFLLAAAPLALAACATTPPPAASVPQTCSAAGLDRYVGQVATGENGTAMLRESGAKTFRWLLFGRMVTMEYRADRLNARLDPKNVILSVNCG